MRGAQPTSWTAAPRIWRRETATEAEVGGQPRRRGQVVVARHIVGQQREKFYEVGIHFLQSGGMLAQGLLEVVKENALVKACPAWVPATCTW